MDVNGYTYGLSLYSKSSRRSSSYCDNHLEIKDDHLTCVYLAQARSLRSRGGWHLIGGVMVGTSALDIHGRDKLSRRYPYLYAARATDHVF